MNQSIFYRPFRYYKAFFYVAMIICPLCFFAAGWSTPYIPAMSFLIVSGCVFACLAKYSYDLSNIVLCLEPDGVQVMNCTQNECTKVSWEDFHYAYYISNFKGHRFIILSPETLLPKDVKRIMNRASNSARVYVGKFPVVPINPLLRPEELSAITRWIDQHLQHIDVRT